MPHRRSDAAYLREKADQFRRLRWKHRTAISKRLLELADELEARLRSSNVPIRAQKSNVLR